MDDFLAKEERLPRGKEREILAHFRREPCVERIEFTKIGGFEDHLHVASEEPFRGFAMDFLVLAQKLFENAWTSPFEHPHERRQESVGEKIGQPQDFARGKIRESTAIGDRASEKTSEMDQNRTCQIVG